MKFFIYLYFSFILWKNISSRETTIIIYSFIIIRRLKVKEKIVWGKKISKLFFSPKKIYILRQFKNSLSKHIFPFYNFVFCVFFFKFLVGRNFLLELEHIYSGHLWPILVSFFFYPYKLCTEPRTRVLYSHPVQ